MESQFYIAIQKLPDCQELVSTERKTALPIETQSWSKKRKEKKTLNMRFVSDEWGTNTKDVRTTCDEDVTDYHF